jgi:hypothetical protein
MSFTDIVDAQTQILLSVTDRRAFEVTLATYNNANDPTGDLRLGVKTQIKDVQLVIDAANKYLINKSVAPFRYTEHTFDDNDNIKTPWDNEKDLVGTVAYAESLIVDPSVEELNVLLDEMTTLANESGKRLVDKQKRVDLIKKSVGQIQDISLNQAQADLKAEQESANVIASTKADLQKSIDDSANVEGQQTTDSFSNTIREQIRARLLQNPEFDNLHIQVEAALVMRKKALDAFYTAKNAEEKHAAMTRINRSAAFEEPIIKIFSTFNPNAYAELVDQLQLTQENLKTSSEALTSAQSNLNSAIESMSAAAISAAQIVFDAATLDFEEKQKARALTMDTLLGFRDSKFSTIMYPGSTYVNEHEIQRITPESESKPTKETSEVISNLTRKVTTGDYVFDTHTATFVSKDKMESGDSGRYIQDNRYPTTKEYEESLYLHNFEVHKTTYDNQTAELTKLKTEENSTYESQKAIKNAFINTELDPETKNQYVKQLNDIEKAHTEFTQENDKQTQVAKSMYDSNVKATDFQFTQSINASQMVASPTESRSVISSFDTAVASSNQAERDFSKARSLAIDRAIAGNSDPKVDPTKPENWSAEDRANVEAKIGNLNTARANELDAAVKLDQYANVTPGGRDSLRAAGLSEAEIDNRLRGGPDSAEATRLRNNAPIAADQVDLAANSIEGSNIATTNGFEILNNGAPFYLQMPTLKSLNDFHIPNGINPYGGKTPDDIARDAIHFNIFEVTPPPPSAVLAPGQSGLIINKINAASTSTIGSFTIYPHNHDYLQLSHVHNYAKSDTIGGIIDGAIQLFDGIDMAASLLNVGINSINTGTQQGIPQKISSSVEKINTYTSSEKMSLTIEFKLFTKNDFLNDVFRPLMFLTALGYPKRVLHGATADNIQGIVKQIGVGQSIADGAKAAQGQVNKFTATGGLGPFRFYMSKKPEYISVRHASGLFYFQLAAITEVSYSFEGPWYNAGDKTTHINGDGRLDAALRTNLNSVVAQTIDSNPSASIKDRFAAIGKTFKDLGGDLSSVLSGKEINMGGPDNVLKNMVKNEFAYPSIASCRVTVTNLIPTFRDDYLQLMDAAGKNGAALVQVTQSQTGTTPPGNPNLQNDIFSTPPKKS